ncbi:hypothetical protein KQ247_20040 [Ruegeria pomeroyi]|uniref:hypothetical protein n=1 Tax=Ruegeria pomeroyi TaxID=89184 RepID=UPI001C1E4AC4|nr:hypothetical protein [Ruegeria pomeroyi]QWV09055.1 hypothetical protein KQ247_20040 [Ruegeria pomeroyi]
MALCLFLGWRMMATVDTVSDRVTASIAELTPLRDEIAGVRAELSGLRADLAAAPGTAASARLQNRLDGLEARLDGMQARMASLATLPDQLLDAPLKPPQTGWRAASPSFAAVSRHRAEPRA